MVAMGLVRSWWMLLALPGTLLIGYAFAGAGMALTTWMRSWQDFEYIQLAILPMFLFSGTFYPLSAYPGWLRHIVEWTPLYQGVLLMRALSLGTVGSDCVIAVVYFAVIGSVGMWVAGHRIGDLLLK
jgi:lipooligosaccharide transport system permease protein